jgi:hypothetical protein
MRPTALFIAALSAAVLVPASASAQTVVLDFSGVICDASPGGGSSSPVACATSGTNRIHQSVGDGPGVDVTYDDGIGNSMLFWDTGYSTLVNVAYGSNTSVTPHIDLQALGGSSITLQGFDLGSWSGSRTTSVTVLDLNGGSTVFSTGPITVSTGAPTPFSFSGLSSNAGFQIRFGPDGFNVGIDNIAFTVSGPPTAVPEPSALALALAGLVGLGIARRRRTAA